MMLKRWLCLVVFLMAGTANSMSQPYSGGEPASAAEMAEECETVLLSAKATSDPDSIELDNSFATGKCWGAFLAIQQFATVKISGSKRMTFRICLPEDTKLVQLVRIFDTYLKKHPERQDEPFTIVAMGSLYEVFRCRQSGAGVH